MKAFSRQARASFGLTAMAVAFLIPLAHAQICGPDDGVDFRVVPDKGTYAPSSTMHIMFVVTNTADTPIYLFRNVSACSSQIGSYAFLLLDSKGKEVRTQGCSSDVDMDSMDVVTDLQNAKTGILLKPYEVHGLQWDVKLPEKKGAYRLKAELVPAGFNMFQEQALAEKKMRILRCSFRAPIVTITIK
jgi:hypothetical protein